METKEQKIERLKKEMNICKQLCKEYKHRIGAISLRRNIKILRQEIKELEDEIQQR